MAINMNGGKFNALVKAAAVFLAVSTVFCVFEACVGRGRKKHMEERRLENETKLAELQLPRLDEEDAAEDGDNYGAGIGAARKVVVIDAGHGRDSSLMSEEEKSAEGYEYNVETETWGEWRHYKNDSFGEDCRGSGCTGLCPEGASCWYDMEQADRDIEPEINLNNALAARKYLEEMGYEVRMTRTSSVENPSMNKRVSRCFPYNDTSLAPDASAYVCIHSNAGGGSGTSYIRLEGEYSRFFEGEDRISASNALGSMLNAKVSQASGLENNGAINSPYLILFNKCPVPIAYLEIGFYDNEANFEALRSSSDAIGKAIAEGIDEYLTDGE